MVHQTKRFQKTVCLKTKDRFLRASNIILYILPQILFKHMSKHVYYVIVIGICDTQTWKIQQDLTDILFLLLFLLCVLWIPFQPKILKCEHKKKCKLKILRIWFSNQFYRGIPLMNNNIRIGKAREEKNDITIAWSGKTAGNGCFIFSNNFVFIDVKMD